MFIGESHKFVLSLLIVFLISVYSSVLHAQEISGSEEKTVSDSVRLEIPKIKGSIKLDGRIKEAAWQQARRVPVVQHSPDFGNAPTEETEFLIGYTEEAVYAACRCYDKGPLSVPSFKRDYAVPDTDFFGLTLDTFNDNENALGFITTPSGLRTDLAISNDASGEIPADFDWNTFWNAEVRQTKEGWFAEIRIPVSTLRFDSKDDKEVTMGLAMTRYIARKPESLVFPAIPPNWGGWSVWKPSQFQEVLFSNMEPAPPLRITPYLLGGISQQSTLSETQTSYEKQTDPTIDAGLDIKYGLSSNLTLDLTVNTDFAQVEADNQQVNLTRFPLFFPEKRRFFLERASNFAFNFGRPNRLFYSRRIGLFRGKQVRILGGARMVGRAGPWDIGLLDMQTAREPGLRSEGRALPSENFGVVRLRRQIINEDSNIGGILTSRIGMNGSFNIAYGLDGIFRVTGQQYIVTKWAQTFKDKAPNTLASLDPARLHLQWERRSFEGFNYQLRYDRAGLRYEPGIGLELRDNYYRFGDRIGYGWIPGEKSPFQRHRLNLEGEAYFRNRNSRLQTLEIGPEWEMYTNTGHSLTVEVSRRTEDLIQDFLLSRTVRVPSGRYTFHVGEISYNMPNGWSPRTSVNVSGGSFYDGRRYTIEFKPTWNVSRYLRIDGFYQYNRIEFPLRNSFTAHLSRLRAEVTPNVEYSISSFIQFNSASDVIVANLRFRYNPRQGNDLYLVYNERLNTSRTMTDGPRLPLSNSRAILLKYTYTFNW